MAVYLSPVGGVAAQFFDNNGTPLAGGLIYTYAAGTSTPAVTYTSSSGIIAHSNPIILDASGRVPTGEIWLSDALAYKFVIKTAQDVLIASYDNISGINSNFVAYTAQQEIQTATAGQTLFTLTTMTYQPGTNNLAVYVDGVNQYGPGAQYAYVETSSTEVTFVSGLHVGASVKFTTATPVASAVVNAENVAYDPPFFGAVGTNVEAKLAQDVSVKDFGAVGDGVTDDTTAFTDAVASGNPVYVPYTTDFYAISALTADEIKALYGPGAVKIAGALQQISSNASALSNDIAGLRYVNKNLQPSKWPTVDGSLTNGASSVTVVRTGGYGSYGINLTDYLVTAATPAPQFDVGQTAWVSQTNLTGGQVFGAWFGCNTPSSSLSETYTGGAAIGMEINVGNRWADFGLQTDIGGTRYTVGLQIVPDVLPASDGTTSAIYPGTFGTVIGASFTGHKWWIGNFIRQDAIMPTGYANLAQGGTTALLAPDAWAKVGDYWNYGLDFSAAICATAPINFSFSNSHSSTASPGGVVAPGDYQGYIKLAMSGTVIKVPYYLD